MVEAETTIVRHELGFCHLIPTTPPLRRHKQHRVGQQRSTISGICLPHGLINRVNGSGNYTVVAIAKNQKGNDDKDGKVKGGNGAFGFRVLCGLLTPREWKQSRLKIVRKTPISSRCR